MRPIKRWLDKSVGGHSDDAVSRRRHEGTIAERRPRHLVSVANSSRIRVRVVHQLQIFRSASLLYS